MKVEACIMWFICLALVFEYSAYTRDFICPKELYQVTMMAKQPYPAAHSNNSGSVNWEVQLCAYENSGGGGGGYAILL
jgi:hypothetical protein